MVKREQLSVIRHSAGSSAEQTRAALVQAALRLFGSQGFEGTSTRDIAAAAQANIGSIAYHFGGKEGLRIACAQYIVDTIQSIAAQTVFSEPDDAASQQAAEAQLSAVLDRMVAFIVAQPEAGEIVQFLLRELAHPTAALETIYTGLFEPVHKRLCDIWSRATGEPAEAESTKIAVFTMIGQVVYFRIGRLPVMRRMGWEEIGPKQASAIASAAKGNLAAILAARRNR